MNNFCNESPGGKVVLVTLRSASRPRMRGLRSCRGKMSPGPVGNDRVHVPMDGACEVLGPRLCMNGSHDRHMPLLNRLKMSPRSSLSRSEYTSGFRRALMYVNHLVKFANSRFTGMNAKTTLIRINGSQQQKKVPMTTPIVLAAFTSPNTLLYCSSLETFRIRAMLLLCCCATLKIRVCRTIITSEGRRKLAQRTNMAYDSATRTKSQFGRTSPWPTWKL